VSTDLLGLLAEDLGESAVCVDALLHGPELGLGELLHLLVDLLLNQK
jgi:hypothetical protein